MTSLDSRHGAAHGSSDAGRCRLCQAASPTEAICVFDDRYGYPGEFALETCPNCGHRALRVDMNAQQVAALYAQYYPRKAFDIDAWTPAREEFGIKAWWRGSRASAYRWVDRGVRVLDIGCGLGESLGYHRARGCDAHGVDADANVMRVAERHGLQMRVGLFDAAHYAPASFDFVTLDQVIEHVADPVALLRGVASILKQDGHVILSTPNAQGWGARVFGRRWIHWHAPYHQQFFSRASIQLAAQAAGLRVQSSRTVTTSAWLGFQWSHLACPTRPGQASAFWSSEVPRTAWQRTLLRLLAVPGRLGIDALLTRVFDALSLGDNRVFVLRKEAAR